MNGNSSLHIVSFTIPHPANYGGVIDVFYKIKALSELGVKITLHCFQYDRKPARELENYCESVYYYARPKKLKYFFSKTPFIVATRSNKELLNRLKNDNIPILLEGIHTCYFLPDLTKDKRNIIVRMHNIEHEYYHHLAKKEKNIFKKFFYKTESKKLLRYEQTLSSRIKIAAITNHDCDYFKNLNFNTSLIEVFHGNDTLNTKTETADYILFHGNLSVHENIEAAKYIIKNISPHINFKFIIAGKNPVKELHSLCKSKMNVELISNPSNQKMDALIQDAQINLLISFQNTGIKLKLINALFKGRHCVTNSLLVENTNLDHLCYVADSEKQIISVINDLLNKAVTQEEINKRQESLLKNVNNKLGAQKLINLLDKNK